MRWWKRGIDTGLLSPPGTPQAGVRDAATDGHPEDFLVVNVGRQAPEKQLELLRRPLLATPGVRLAPIGDGPSHPQLRQIFADTPLRCLR
jgi:phosphatidylinositol alpha 1,6-mannosyltransferase